MEWDLTTIYPSLGDVSFLEDIEKLKQLVSQWNYLVPKLTHNANVCEQLKNALHLELELMMLASKLGGYVSLISSVDTDNSRASKFEDLIDQIVNQTVEQMTNFEEFVSQIDIDQLILEDDFLNEHAFILKEIKQSSTHRLSSKEESIIAMMRQTGSTSFARLKDQIIGNMLVDFQVGETVQKMPLTMILNKAYDKDPTIRKQAYLAEIAAYKQTQDGLAACLNAIKGEAITIASLRGYTSVLDQTLFESRMDKQTLDVMLEAIKESLPKFRHYMKVKARYLGYENGLPFYELYAPVVDDVKEYSYEEAGDFVCQQFATFDQEMADMARCAIDNRWIDIYPRKGKVGGAFCAGVPSLKESRILLNFGGTFDSVVTMAHELGHAYHNLCGKNESLLNLNSPMPLAETASTFNETIVKKAAIKTLPKKEALAVLETEISGCNQVIVDIYSRFLFEDSLIKARQDGPLSANEICALMEQAQIESYGDGLDKNYRHPYMWTWKPHYYYATSNYYNFPYAFGQLFAKGLYAIYLQKGAVFVPEYKKLLASTGKMSIYDVAKRAGIDVHDLNFWRNSIQMICDDIDTFEQLLNDECF